MAGYIGFGWNIGGHKSGVGSKTPGSKMNREQEYTITEITLIGKAGDVKDWNDKDTTIHRVEIRVLTKDGKTLAATNTLGTLRDVMQQAKDIQAKGESIQSAAQRAADEGHTGPYTGGGGSGRKGKSKGGSYDPDPNAPDSWQ